MLIILCFTLFVLKKDTVSADTSEIEKQSTDNYTEYVYVYVPADTATIENTDTHDGHGWIIREHEGQIGIFTSDGSFIRTIDVYLKTLPSADRALLREGIAVSSKKELLAVIEDYTG